MLNEMILGIEDEYSICPAQEIILHSRSDNSGRPSVLGITGQGPQEAASGHKQPQGDEDNGKESKDDGRRDRTLGDRAAQFICRGTSTCLEDQTDREAHPKLGVGVAPGKLQQSSKVEDLMVKAMGTI